MSSTDPVRPLRPRLQRVLDDFLDRQRAILVEIGTEFATLVEAAADLLAGGKRLRPAFCYWGWRGTGRADCEAIVAVAAALELFQAAALVHDDLIDGSDTRRGMPSAHRRFAAQHRDAGWAHGSDRFGAAASILLGDLLLGWSDELLTGSGLEPDELYRAKPIFDRMRTEVGAGQYLDVLAQVRSTASASEMADMARRVVRYKAARYSVERPLLLGGSAAGADPALLDGYSGFGLALGEAFQLRDDILGVFGDPDVTGKPAGDDLREGKRTLLIGYTFEHADRRMAARITTLLGDSRLDEDGVAELQRIIVDTGALARLEETIADRIEAARVALGKAELADGEARAALEQLITAATTRSA